MTLAQALRAWRRRKFLTQKALAEAIPVSLNTVQRWELGLTVPYPATQRRLIEVLEISPDELFAALDATEAERGKGAA